MGFLPAIKWSYNPYEWPFFMGNWGHNPCKWRYNHIYNYVAGAHLVVSFFSKSLKPLFSVVKFAKFRSNVQCFFHLQEMNGGYTEEKMMAGESL